MRLLLLVCAGGAIGSGVRHLVNVGAYRYIGTAYPWGTLTVNIVGSFLMGVVMETVMLRYSDSVELRAMLATGFLGGFTTFSTFSLDFFHLMQRGETGAALLYAAVSVMVSILAVYAGFAAARVVL